MSWVIKDASAQMLGVDAQGKFTWTPKAEDALQFFNKVSAQGVTAIPETPVQAWRSIEELP